MSTSRGIEAAKAFVRVTMEDGELRKKLSGLKGTLGSVGDAFGGVMANATLAGLAAAGAGLVTLAADAERTQVAFEVMLGSASRAQKMIEDINRMGTESPFGAADFMRGAQLLLNFGMAADEVIPSLSMLGDVAAGDADKLARMTLAFAQVQATGRLMGQDLLQMINAGFNPLQEISRKTGESMSELKTRMEAGGISAEEVAKAFQSATSEGGRFYGMTARIAATTGGKWATVKDEVLMLARDMGQQLLPIVNVTLAAMTGLVAMFGDWGPEIVQAGAALAAFLITMKALTLAQIAFSKAAAVAQAFSGPKGWAVLAVGAAAAATAVAAIDLSTSKLAESAREAHPPLNTMAKDLSGVATVAPKAADGLMSFDEATKQARQSIRDMADDATKARSNVEAFKDALARSGKFGVVFDMSPLVQQFREHESGYTDMLKSIQDEIDILTGKATEAGLELQHMMEVGVEPAKIEQLRQLIAKRDQIEEGKKAAEFWAQREEDLRASADRIKEAIETVDQSFARQQTELQQMVSAGVLTASQAETYLRQNPEFARILDGLDPDAIRDRTNQSSEARDVRTVEGFKQITALINGPASREQRKLALLQQIERGIFTLPEKLQAQEVAV